MAHFEVFKNGQRQQPIAFNGNEMVIGRAPEAEVLLHDLHCSRRHARVFPDEGFLVLEDLGTENGTFVNGRREYKRRLANGDKIQIASYVLVWCQAPTEYIAPPDEDPCARTMVDSSLFARAAAMEEGAVQGTSVVGPGVLARMRAEADARLGAHLIEERPSGPYTHSLKHQLTIIGAGDRCQLRFPAMGKEMAASLEKLPDGSVELKKIGWFTKVLVKGKRVKKVRLDADCRIEIQGVTLFFRPGKR